MHYAQYIFTGRVADKPAGPYFWRMQSGGRLPRMNSTRFKILAIGLSAFTAALTADSRAMRAAGLVPFLSHQAVYELSLANSRRSPSVDAVSGRIAYSFAGTACEGYTTDFRQVSRIESGDGKGLLSDLRSSSWEEADGKTYRFKVETRTNEATPTVIEGTAERTDKGLTVTLRRPQARTVTFESDVVFPTDQIKRIIAAAKDGKPLLQLLVYDGSDNGQKIYSTLTVIGQPIPGDRAPVLGDSATGNSALSTITRWPVTVSYYDRTAKPNSGEQTPIYAMSFELYENGVSRALSLDYNDFVVGGIMSKLDVRDSKACDK